MNLNPELKRLSENRFLRAVVILGALTVAAGVIATEGPHAAQHAVEIARGFLMQHASNIQLPPIRVEPGTGDISGAAGPHIQKLGHVAAELFSGVE